MQTPLVSVRLMVYNNEPYIREAVESILMQKTNFKVEIVVGDDFSTDNSLQIIKSYKDTENISFKILQREVGGEYWQDRQRFGRLHNFRNIIDNCSGKYIALLDGDDYWTDPLKLQKQVAFLEQHGEYGICFHEALVKWDSSDGFNSNIKYNSEFPWNKMDVSETSYTISNVFDGPFMATASVVFKNPYIKDFPSWFYEALSGDITLYALILGKKKIKFINEVMSAYRRHPGSITRFHKGNATVLNRIVTLKHINKHYENLYLNDIQQAVGAYLNNLHKISLRDFLLVVKLFFTSNIIVFFNIHIFNVR